MDLTLAKALRLASNYAVTGRLRDSSATAFVGAGGKTTAMFQLAGELPPPVIVTASTHLATSQAALAGRHIQALAADDLEAITLGNVTLVTGRAGEDGRTEPVSDQVMQRLRGYASQHQLRLLIEADGSRQKPLKAPAAHEPAIPEFADLVVLVAGLTGLGRPLSHDGVQRSEIFAKLSGGNPGEPVTSAALTRVLTHPEGGLKNIPPRARRVVLLNQADTPELQAVGHEMVPGLLPTFGAVIVAAVAHQSVFAVHEPAAGIILAAGESRRLGKPKQLLEWQGQTFVRAAASTALAAGLAPVVVITGASGDEVAAAVRDLPVIVTMNEDWRSGQASSISKGLQALPANVGSAVFLLADQPQIPSGVLTGLVEQHAAGLSPIVAPLVQGNRRGNPVLFDKVTFEALQRLSGDEGGRAVFNQFRVEYLPWNDERLLIDVDTDADYKHLRESYGE